MILTGKLPPILADTKGILWAAVAQLKSRFHACFRNSFVTRGYQMRVDLKRTLIGNPPILHQEYGDWIVTGKWRDMVMTSRSYFGVSNFCLSILDMFAVVML